MSNFNGTNNSNETQSSIFKNLSSKIKLNLTAKQLTFCAVAIAIAYITSTYLCFTKLPYGGSITFFSMLFVCLIGYLYGPAVGITTGLAYGLLQLITNPYIVHPMQVVFDYFFAFGALGLSGFFQNSKHGLVKGYIVGVLGRYVFSVISGCIFFAEYAAEGQTVIAYSMTYNATYILPEMIITIAVIPLLNRGFIEVKKMAIN